MLRTLRTTLLLALALPVLAWAAVLLFLNVGLPHLLNRNPDRLSVSWRAAWMLVPGRIELRDLKIVSHGPRDDWTLTADGASTWLALEALRERELRLTALQANGAAFSYARHPGEPGTGPKWRVVLEGAEIRDVRAISVEGYTCTGPLDVIGSAAIGGPTLTADLDLRLRGGRLSRGETPLAHAVTGRVGVELDGWEPRTGLASLDRVTATAAIDADLASFDFLDYYLEAAPWLRLDGTGHVALAAGLAGGRLTDGSTFRIDTEDLAVRFLGYHIAGDATLEGTVGTADDGTPRSQASVQYRRYTIAEAGAPALVTGAGFRVDAVSPDVALDRPFTSLALVLDLPESHVPDFRRFAGYLPQNVGFEVLGGKGTVRGVMRATVPSDVATGDLYLDGSGLRATFDGLAMTADLGIHAHLERGALTSRTYDFSGSSVSVRRFEMVDPAAPDEPLIGSGPWTARVEAKRGVAKPGRDTWLDTEISMRCTNSAPFVKVVARRKKLAPWVQNLLDLPDVNGTARVAFGPDSVDIDGLTLRGGQLEVLLDWLRERKDDKATLFARYGIFSLGVGLDHGKRSVQLTGARAWHAERTGRQATIAQLAEPLPAEERRGREARKARRERRKAD